MKTITELMADNLLEMYDEDDNLKSFHVLHMYPRKKTKNDGLKHCRFFHLVVFNLKTMKYKDYGSHHDTVWPHGSNLSNIAVYEDGSTVIVFKDKVNAPNFFTQSVFLF